MRRLLVMRHAKSDWAAGTSDHARPLNSRGVAAAEAMGDLLAAMGEVPDHAITSTAVRAATTLRLAAGTGRWSTTIEETDDLYGTSTEGAMAVAARAPDVERLMLVGHQPTWGNLVAHLTGGAVAVKTATVVGIDLYTADWESAEMARGEIVYVVQPRMLGTDGG